MFSPARRHTRAQIGRKCLGLCSHGRVWQAVAGMDGDAVLDVVEHRVGVGERRRRLPGVRRHLQRQLVRFRPCERQCHLRLARRSLVRRLGCRMKGRALKGTGGINWIQLDRSVPP